MEAEGELPVPGWLGGLVEETFFAGCGTHESMKKNEKNIFCLHCCTSICPHCAPSHPSHPLLQVEHVVMQGVDISSILFRYDEPEFTFAQFESLRMDGSDLPDDEAFDRDQITPNSIIAGGSSANEESGNSGKSDERRIKKSGGGGGGGGRGFLPGIVLSLNNRRKGAPHRSPLS